MSEHFTHIAVFEDVTRLLFISPEICDVFKSSLRKFYDTGLLASTSRGNHLFAIPILEKLTNLSNAKSIPDESAMKISAALGWILHRASDLQMKPLFAATDAENNPQFNGYKNSIYHDVMAFRQIYNSGNTPSLSPKEFLSPATFELHLDSHPGALAIDVAQAEPLFNWMWQKEMIAMFTFSTHEKDFEKWVDKIVTTFPKFTEDFRDYVAAFQQPHPDETKKYWDDVNYYNPEDEIIRLTRALQQAQPTEIDLKTALEKAQNQSQYAQALRRGYYFILGTNDFFIGKRSKADAYEAIEMNQQFRF
ncbi:hypothetical protein JW964_15810 [candidate division KSB1 bacterium]|nr:hypothetical protein [candidate division KSB1 bacterium]